MKIFSGILFFALCMVSGVLYSQNHVANPSFEDVESCPDLFFQIYKSPPWFSPICEPVLPGRQSNAVLFTGKTPCSSSVTGVPQNAWCNQGAHSGSSYAGIEVISTYALGPAYRQYLETKLLSPLGAGKKYLFSMFYNLCYPEFVSSDIICFNMDSLGAYFSTNIIEKSPNCQPLRVSPQISEPGKQILPSQGWQEFSGCITAVGNEQYMTIGNFAANSRSSCSTVDSIGYYLYVDDVSVIPEQTKQFDTVICGVNDWVVNAVQLREEYTTLGGWKYEWSDGSNEMQRKFTAPGNYTLSVTNKDCFTDLYYFNISFLDCSCTTYIPNTFTPNGDNLNDRFIPHIVCQTQQVSGYRFSVFDRWGTRVFFTSSPAQSWDGTYRNRPVTAGHYVYQVEYKTLPVQEVKKEKGTILLIR